MASETGLRDLWRVRNAAAMSLAQSEEQMKRAIRQASVEELVAMIDTFSPARSTGPEWTRTFEPLVERLWMWADDATMARLAEVYRARGMPWAAVGNALIPEHGKAVREGLRQPAWARLPAFAVA
ncbi:MAG: hypothetical protein AB7O57_23240 [Hyphomicrobiaceae bacterium]